MSHGNTQVSGIIDPPDRGVAQGMLKTYAIISGGE